MLGSFLVEYRKTIYGLNRVTLNPKYGRLSDNIRLTICRPYLSSVILKEKSIDVRCISFTSSDLQLTPSENRIQIAV